jgi:hypothetical protein
MLSANACQFKEMLKVLALNYVKRSEGRGKKIKTIVRHPVLKPVRYASAPSSQNTANNLFAHSWLIFYLSLKKIKNHDLQPTHVQKQ